MKRSTVAIMLLGAALMASNAWWAYHVLDRGVSLTYQGESLRESQEGLSQALAVINATAAHGASRTQVVAAAQKAAPGFEPFEKDGYLWVGRLGFRFNEAGQLVETVSEIQS